MPLYQILMALLLPAMLAHAWITGGRRALRERWGLAAAAARTGQRLWLHGASNGELASARAVLQEILAARPGLAVLVTSNSLTGRDLVEGWGLPRVTAALAPLDTAGAAARLMDRFQPQALVILENELWPSRLAAAHRRGVQILVIGARLSEGSAARWRLWPGLIGDALARLDWVSAQDEASARRLVKLGLPQAALGPTVTLKAMPAAPAAPQVPPFAPPAPRAACLLAASTHPGEEGPILTAFAGARLRGGPSFLILAPRHARRGDEVAALIASQGLTLARRSAGQAPGPDTQVYLADTMGEMGLWYAMAGICLIGGTFTDRGGHTPFEPAAHGCALIHGPDVANFAAPFAALDAAGGAIGLKDFAGLEAALCALPAGRQESLAAAGRAALAPFGRGRKEITERILAALPGLPNTAG